MKLFIRLAVPMITLSGSPYIWFLSVYGSIMTYLPALCQVSEQRKTPRFHGGFHGGCYLAERPSCRYWGADELADATTGFYFLIKGYQIFCLDVGCHYFALILAIAAHVAIVLEGNCVARNFTLKFYHFVPLRWCCVSTVWQTFLHFVKYLSKVFCHS